MRRRVGNLQLERRMPAWDSIVELLRQTVFLLAHHMDGSLGAAIFTVSAVARILILPLSVRAALAARAQAERASALEPELARLRIRHAKDPGKLMAATGELYRAQGISPLPSGTLLMLAVQIPLGLALYQAIQAGVSAGRRFLWIGDLARPDLALTAVVGALAGLTAWATGATQPSSASSAGVSTYLFAVASCVLTVVFSFRLASGIGVYWAASSLIGLVQPVIVSRLARREGR